MNALRKAKLLFVELRYLQRGVSWPRFLVYVAQRTLHKLRQRLVDPNAFKAKWEALAAPTEGQKLYGRIMSRPAPLRSDVVVPPRTVNWVMPDFGVSGGGHINMFRFIGALEDHGYRCRVYIDSASQFASGEQALASIRRHFSNVNAEVFPQWKVMAPAEFTFATTWRSAYTVRAFGETTYKCYFVQDFEPYFYPRGNEYEFAENTYRFDFIGVTAGTWLSTLLRERYGMQTFPLGFSFDKALYSQPVELPKAARGPRIFFYSRPTTPRRGFDVGVLALAEVKRRHPEAEIVMAGWDLAAYHVPFEHEDRGALPLADLPDLFRSCDIALVLSYSNLSLLPLELMACGCAVVSNKGDFVEWLLDDRNALLVNSDVDSIADGICRLIESPAERLRLQRAGRGFAEQTDWAREGERLAGYLDAIRQQTNATSLTGATGGG